jgi:tRNA nucleotidyltransferase (CCA-adding enzyme)
MALRIAATLSPEARVRFATLVHDLGKADTPEEEWPKHIGHEGRGALRVRELGDRLKAPRAFSELGEMTSRFHLDIHRGAELRPRTLVKKLMEMDALRRPERFHEMLLACEADARGRLGLEGRAYPQRAFWLGAHAALRSVSPRDLQARGLEGEAFIKALEQARKAALHEYRENWRASHG